jgi:hypothetical protein
VCECENYVLRVAGSHLSLSLSLSLPLSLLIRGACSHLVVRLDLGGQNSGMWY